MKEKNRRPIDQGWRGNRRLTIRKFNRWYTSDELIASDSLPGHVRDKVIGFIKEKKHATIIGATPMAISSAPAKHPIQCLVLYSFQEGEQVAVVNGLIIPQGQMTAVRTDSGLGIWHHCGHLANVVGIHFVMI
jgi:hypothetical protein